MDKPQKPENLLPSSFGGIKENFSEDRVKTGYEPDVPQIVEGENLNYLIDGIGKNFDYNNKISDFVVGLPINNIITADENNKLVYKNIDELGGSGGLEVGDIGIALYVDETKGLRRYLNGSQLPINTNTQGFLDKLKAAAVLYPSLLAESQEAWDTIKTMSGEGQCGKFFINEDEGYIQLPRVVKLQGCLNLANIGDIVEAGVPNIKVAINNSGYSLFWTGQDVTVSGAAKVKTTTAKNASTNSSGAAPTGLDIDASIASSVYKDDFDNVQEEAIQYPYFIQIATGQETEVNITNELSLVNPFTLLESKYSEKPLYNADWLLSNGQWNSSGVYVSVWEVLLTEYNAEIEAGTTVTLPSGRSYTKRGLSVKAFTEEYDDYDFVINQDDETFRLPLLDGSENLVDYSTSKDISSLLTTTTPYVVSRNSYIKCSLGAGTNLECTVDGHRVIYILGVPSNVTITDGCFVKAGDTIVTVRRSGSYVYCHEHPCFSNGSLYFYVGEVEENHSLINLGRMQEQFVNKADKTSWVFSGVKLAKSVSMTNNKEIVLDLSTILPNDNQIYEVLTFTSINSPVTQYKACNLQYHTDIISSYVKLLNAGSPTASSAGYPYSTTTMMICGKERKIYIKNTADTSVITEFSVQAYRRVG